MSHPKLRVVVLALIAVFLVYAAYADTITLSTFYPSPYGSYQNLDTTGNTFLATDGSSKVGVGHPTGTLLLDTLDVNGTGRFSSTLQVFGQIVSNLAQGTAPLSVTSNTVVPNLNADLLDGKDASTFDNKLNDILGRIGSVGALAGSGSLFAWMQKLYDKPSACYVDYSGSCSVSGFASKANLGSWGMCWDGLSNHSAVFRPPGVNDCLGNYVTGNIGQNAILCCA